MSRSRRAAQVAAVETIFRLGGGTFVAGARARLWVDLNCRTGLRCPACGGAGKAPMAKDDLAARQRRGKSAFRCDLCDGQGALRARAFAQRERNEDFAIVAGARP